MKKKCKICKSTPQEGMIYCPYLKREVTLKACSLYRFNGFPIKRKEIIIMDTKEIERACKNIQAGLFAIYEDYSIPVESLVGQHIQTIITAVMHLEEKSQTPQKETDLLPRIKEFFEDNVGWINDRADMGDSACFILFNEMMHLLNRIEEEINKQ